MHLRIRFVKAGGHVHCQVSSATRKDVTHAVNGNLVFSLKEWDQAVWDSFLSIAEVVDDTPPS